MDNIDKIRNIGIVAHIDAGKTTTTERLLYYTGRIYRIGSVDEGTATMDYMVQEKEHGITIQSASTFFKWKDYEFNLIDTPGHVDFTVEVERAIRVLDGAIVILDASAGVQPQTETVYRQTLKYKVPILFFVNKMDKLGANFEFCLKSIKERLLINPIPIQVPYFENDVFVGTIDLINMILFSSEDNEGRELDIVEIEKNKLNDWRVLMLEEIASLDEAFMEKYFNEDFTLEDIKEALRRITINCLGAPVLCGSAIKNIGIYSLLDSVIDYLPSPLDRSKQKAFIIDKEGKEKEVEIDVFSEKDLLALCFKVSYFPSIGKVCFVRVYNGVIQEGMSLYNSTRDLNEKTGKIMKIHANYMEDKGILTPGQIGVILGLKNTYTGDSLTYNKRIVLESIYVPEPVIFSAIEVQTKADEDKLFKVLERLSQEDPTFRYKINEETGQIIIFGMGELHLDIIKDRIQRDHNLKIYSGNPQVDYKESIKRKAYGEYNFYKQLGNKLQTAYVKVEVLPIDEGIKVFIDTDQITDKFFSSIKEGIHEALSFGPLAGFSCVKVKVRLIDGKYDKDFSTPLAFKVAAFEATRIALQNAEPILLEPIMKVEIITPEDYMGAIINDVQSRDGEVHDISIYQSMGSIMINKLVSFVPLRNMFGYSTVLRSLSQGRASFSMELYSYKQVPLSIQESISFGKI
jgi:elongation factor G